MVRADKFIPNRGDIVWIDFDPQAGHEQAGRRPSLVLSPKKYNSIVGLAVFCPITKNIKGYPFEVMIPEDSKISGVILSDHVKNLDWRARKAEFICKVPNDTLSDVLSKLGALLTIKTSISSPSSAPATTEINRLS